MAQSESLRQIAHSRAPLSAWLGTMLLFVLFGAIVLALVGPARRTDEYELNRAKKRYETLKGLREQDAKALGSYEVVDKAQGTAHIPIERAMELTLAELAQKKPAAAYPVGPPAAPAMPAQAGSPAAPAKPSAAPASSPTPTAPASHTSSGVQATPATVLKEIEGPKSEIHNQPAGAANPPAAKPGTQPGGAATPQASPAPPSGRPAVSPTGTPNQSPPGSPLPIPGKTP
jgi:hypothetical protein